MNRFPFMPAAAHFRQFSAGLGLISLLAAAGGCVTDNTPPPAIQVKTVTRTLEVQRPCAVAVPPRPAPLARPLPTDAVALAALLGEKLLEWAGPGGYGDRATDALNVCVRAQP